VQETVTVGSKAPDFELPSTTGEQLGPGHFAGRKRVVLAFYPRDNTSG
jgi:thioredoxin-dependent peroxiredoxin